MRIYRDADAQDWGGNWPQEWIDRYNNGMKGGFKKISGPKQEKRCNASDHNPPSHVILEPGQYEYTCSSCGHTTTINVPEIRYL